MYVNVNMCVFISSLLYRKSGNFVVKIFDVLVQKLYYNMKQKIYTLRYVSN